MDVLDLETTVLVFSDCFSKVRDDEAFLSSWDACNGTMGQFATDGMQERKAVEENEIEAYGDESVVLKDVRRQRKRVGGCDLNGLRSGFMTFDVWDVLAVDVLSTLGIIDGEGGVSDVTVGEETLKISWGPGADVMAKVLSFVRACNLATGERRFVGCNALKKGDAGGRIREIRRGVGSERR